MQVVLVEPGKAARITEIGEDLQDMQEIVGGLIQALYPWEDPAAIVCNDEGKIMGLPLNRVLEDYPKSHAEPAIRVANKGHVYKIRHCRTK